MFRLPGQLKVCKLTHGCSNNTKVIVYIIGTKWCGTIIFLSKHKLLQCWENATLPKISLLPCGRKAPISLVNKYRNERIQLQMQPLWSHLGLLVAKRWAILRIMLFDYKFLHLFEFQKLNGGDLYNISNMDYNSRNYFLPVRVGITRYTKPLNWVLSSRKAPIPWLNFFPNLLHFQEIQ